MTEPAEQRAAEDRPNRLPPISALSVPGDEEWDPDTGAMGTPITGEDDEQRQAVR